MTLSDDERHLLVSVVSVWLRRAGGDAGAMMLDAYRQILSETEPAVRTVMLEFLESGGVSGNPRKFRHSALWNFLGGWSAA